MRFSEQVVLVAGGTGGLGRSVSLAFLVEGAKVVVTYRKEEEFAALNAEAALVNTVGGFAFGGKLWESDTKVFEQMLALNLRSGLMLSRAVIPGMLKQKSGAIVNVASKSAIEHAAGLAAYAASKAAALALMDSLAEELKGTGVRANSILPSIIDTDANRKAMPAADFAKWPKPEDIARVILFLCSPDAKVIHGAAIPVYGAD
jgi:NAD(P)-dependent dehydrogenase (short-subunit alcohol dehydrogenase family)